MQKTYERRVLLDYMQRVAHKINDVYPAFCFVTFDVNESNENFG